MDLERIETMKTPRGRDAALERRRQSATLVCDLCDVASAPGARGWLTSVVEMHEGPLVLTICPRCDRRDRQLFDGERHTDS